MGTVVDARSESLAQARLVQALRSSAEFRAALGLAGTGSRQEWSCRVETEVAAADTRSDIVLRSAQQALRLELKLDASFTPGQTRAIQAGNGQIDAIIVPDTRSAEVRATLRSLGGDRAIPRVLTWHEVEALADGTQAAEVLRGVGIWSRRGISRLAQEDFVRAIAGRAGDQQGADFRTSFFTTLAMLLEQDPRVESTRRYYQSTLDVGRCTVDLHLPFDKRWVWEAPRGCAFDWQRPLPIRRRPRSATPSVQFLWSPGRPSEWICAVTGLWEGRRRPHQSPLPQYPKWAQDLVAKGTITEGVMATVGSKSAMIEADHIAGLVAEIMNDNLDRDDGAGRPPIRSSLEEVGDFRHEARVVDCVVMDLIEEAARRGAIGEVQAVREDGRPVLLASWGDGSGAFLHAWQTGEIWAFRSNPDHPGIATRPDYVAWRPGLNDGRAIEAVSHLISSGAFKSGLV